MGQKSNPNSFQQQNNDLSLWSSHSKVDYSILLKNNFEITQAVHSLFERHKLYTLFIQILVLTIFS